eukprot:Unigene9393_Nuclearia_a/m.28681 Unigene9393_Nuclearia_a/g.28681  ORF Unigene9393_Nuclearia_a/g.28681 Unigene9393_Nuclearia_a/m.28681 type:complete len:763 (-) Unigene9393_Nuclearia_a:31-2319(-)
MSDGRVDPAADVILVERLLVRGVVGVDNWERQKKQDIVVHLVIYADIGRAGATDDVAHTINYSDVTKVVVDFVEASQYKSVEGLAEGIAQTCLVRFELQAITVRVEKPRALLNAAAAGVEITRARDSQTFRPFAELRVDDRGVYHSEDRVFISDMRVRLIVGVNPPEREEKQDVIVNLSMWSLGRASSTHDYVPRAYNYRTICHMVTHMLEASAFRTIEAMATEVARLLVTKCHIRRVSVRVNKPSALLFAQSAGVEITRDATYYSSGGAHTARPSARPALPDVAATAPAASSAAHTAAPQPTPQALQPHSTAQHIVFLALGSNLGDRAAHINQALERLTRVCDCTVLDTSFLYETPPAYVTDQPMFLNAVCKASTARSPRELLVGLKMVERDLGRTPTIPNGPRVIDLDILFYDDVEVAEDDLIIPHPRLHEREFVLRPLCDIAASLEHPKLQKTVEHLWRHLHHRTAIPRVLPVGLNKLWHLGSRTYIMGILNVTPDSFSDGGKFLSLDAAVSHAWQMIEQGASVVDIGGASTKPNVNEVTVEEEIRRVVPVIRRLREEGVDVPLSVDTWRAQVAQAAVEAGATMINDVSGGTRDSAMYATMAAANVPVCLMHMRGDTRTMMLPESKEYPEDDVVTGVRQELATRVHNALRAGVRRWHILIDPGLGFAKHPHQSIQLLRSLSQVIAPGQDLEGFPTLVGPSRKGFIGAVLNKDATERTWGTAAACAALVAEGVDVLRVHDVAEMADVVKVSDAIWRAQRL